MDVRIFLRWWFDQLAGLAPSFLASPRHGSRAATIVTADGDGVRVAVRSRKTISNIGDLDAAAALGRARLPAAAIVQPHAQDVLRKHVTLPAAAAGHLRRLLSFELERETPFSADEVYWDFAVMHRSPDGTRLDVEIALVPRDRLAPILAQARSAGLRPTAIELPFASRAPHLVSLNDTPLTDADPWLPRLAGAAAALALAAAIMPWVAQQYALSAAEERLAVAHTSALQVAALREQVDRLGGRSSSASGGVLAALAATTDALPDGSYLQALSLHGNRLVLSGYSARAADLIGRFAQAPAFRAPAFQSPVARGGDANVESFVLAVEVVEAAP
jgi:general secretion pathway protein L